jgi:hypothetical protein
LTEYSQTDRYSRGSIIESTDWMVLHRPVELAAETGQVDWGPGLSVLFLLQFHALGAFRDLIVNVLEFQSHTNIVRILHVPRE